MGRRVASLAYPLHEQAVKRHVAWAREFASVGDVEAVDDELDDIRALTAELDGLSLPAHVRTDSRQMQWKIGSRRRG
jgi:hypothetical protein